MSKIQNWGAKRRIQEKFEAVSTEGRRLLATTGQKGFLVEQRIYDEMHSAGPVVHFADDGTSLVGVGPSPEAVLFAKYPRKQFRSAAPAGAILRKDSHFVWVESSETGYTVKQYSLRDLDEAIDVVAANKAVVETLGQSIYLDAVTSYSERLRQVARGTEAQQEIDSLLQSRNAALKEVDAIQGELSAQLERAKRADSNAKKLQMWANVFEGGAFLAGVFAEYSDKPSPARDGQQPSMEELRAKIDTVSKEAHSNVKYLQVRETKLMESLTDAEVRMFEMSIIYKLDPKPIQDLKPKN